jgi:hypothetical protein
MPMQQGVKSVTEVQEADLLLPDSMFRTAKYLGDWQYFLNRMP